MCDWHKLVKGRECFKYYPYNGEQLKHCLLHGGMCVLSHKPLRHFWKTAQSGWDNINSLLDYRVMKPWVYPVLQSSAREFTWQWKGNLSQRNEPQWLFQAKTMLRLIPQIQNQVHVSNRSRIFPPLGYLDLIYSGRCLCLWVIMCGPMNLQISTKLSPLEAFPFPGKFHTSHKPQKVWQKGKTDQKASDSQGQLKIRSCPNGSQW